MPTKHLKNILKGASQLQNWKIIKAASNNRPKPPLFLHPRLRNHNEPLKKPLPRSPHNRLSMRRIMKHPKQERFCHQLAANPCLSILIIPHHHHYLLRVWGSKRPSRKPPSFPLARKFCFLRRYFHAKFGNQFFFLSKLLKLGVVGWRF